MYVLRFEYKPSIAIQYGHESMYIDRVFWNMSIVVAIDGVGMIKMCRVRVRV
jgi:hypothetical protein